MEPIQLLTKQEVCILLHNQLLKDLVALELDLKNFEKQTLIGNTSPQSDQNYLLFQQKARQTKDMLGDLEKQIKGDAPKERSTN